MLNIIIIQHKITNQIALLQLENIKKYITCPHEITLVKNGCDTLSSDKLANNILNIDNNATQLSFHHAIALDFMYQKSIGPVLFLDHDCIPINEINFSDFDILTWDYTEKLLKEGHPNPKDKNFWPGLLYIKSCDISFSFKPDPKNRADTGYELYKLCDGRKIKLVEHRWVTNFEYPSDLLIIDGKPSFFHISKASNWHMQNEKEHNRRINRAIKLIKWEIPFI